MKSLIFTATLTLACSSAGAQVSYVSNNPPQMKGDPKKVVCEREETIGTRLGARSVCLTVEQWNEKHREQREFTENIQSGTWGQHSPEDVELKMSDRPQ
jgi:hypothetical protein